MSVTREFSERMADFIMAVSVAKPGQVVPLPQGATEEHLRVALDIVEEMKAHKPRWFYERQADGIYR